MKDRYTALDGPIEELEEVMARKLRQIKALIRQREEISVELDWRKDQRAALNREGEYGA